jgi:hypothetical protein
MPIRVFLWTISDLHVEVTLLLMLPSLLLLLQLPPRLPCARRQQMQRQRCRVWVTGMPQRCLFRC